MSRRYSPMNRYDTHRERPKVEGLKVEWIKTVEPEAVFACRRLRRNGLLHLYSMQVYEINLKRCDPGSEHCKRCLVRKKSVEKVGWGGPDVCSLVMALLVLECGFYKMSVAEVDHSCSFCEEKIIRGHWHSNIVQFGYEPLRLCLRCLLPDERG